MPHGPGPNNVLWLFSARWVGARTQSSQLEELAILGLEPPFLRKQAMDHERADRGALHGERHDRHRGRPRGRTEAAKIEKFIAQNPF